MNSIKSKLEEELKRKYVIYEEKISELMSELEKERRQNSSQAVTAAQKKQVEESENNYQSQGSHSFGGDKTQRLFRETFGKQQTSSHLSQPSVASNSPKFKSVSQENVSKGYNSATVSPVLASHKLGIEHDIQSDKTELKGDFLDGVKQLSSDAGLNQDTKINLGQGYINLQSSNSPKDFATVRSSQQSLNIDEIRSILVQVEQLEYELNEKERLVERLSNALTEAQESLATKIQKKEEEWQL